MTRGAILRFAVTAAGALAATAPAAAQQLTGAGASFPFPIYSKWFDQYHRLHPSITINYQSIGSGGGIQNLQKQTVDFGASDAPLSDEEAKSMPGPVVHIPTVAGAVAIAYHLPELHVPLKLSGAVLADIYLGKITHWNDPRLVALNKGVALPPHTIIVAHRSDGSGTSYIFTHYLAAVSPAWKSKVGAGKSVNWPLGIGGKGNDGVTAAVRQTPGGIGYIELAYAKENHVPYAEVQNKSGKFVAPSVESTTAAAAGGADALKSDIRTPIVNSSNPNAYPIAGFTYILVYRNMKDVAHGKVMAEFLRWAIHDGQGMAKALDYAPLPKSVVSLDTAALKTLRAGGVPL